MSSEEAPSSAVGPEDERCNRWYREALSYLPKTCGALLDIGCGRGRVDVVLHNHYLLRQQFVHIHLLDGAEVREKQEGQDTGWRPEMKPWASVLNAHGFLLKHGLASGFVRLWTVPPPPEIYNERFDLILSIRSWGHHYPLSTYAELAQQTLTPTGVIIVDSRVGREDNRALVDVGFRVLTSWPSGEKAIRTVFKRSEQS